MRRRAILLLMSVGAALMLSSTVALAVTRQCEAYDPVIETGECFGTDGPDTLLGTQDRNYMLGRGAGDVLKGFGDTDILYGEAGSDRLLGGAGSDSLVPGPGDDTSAGGVDGDSYSFESSNWGKDTIEERGAGNGVHFDVNTDLTIRLISDPARPEVRNADGTSTVNWGGNVISRATSQSSGDDKIYGNPAANDIDSFAGGGDDEVFGRQGNDSIDVADGAAGDIVDCGENAGDSDVVVYDGLGDLVTNCEDARPQ